MKKIKAFTLIEIIVSIAIIGILAVAMLPVMSGGLMFLNRSKVITQNMFSTQKEMELAIESAKEHSSGLTAKMTKIFDGHDIEVSYYEVSIEKDGKKYSTLVSETRPLEYQTLEITGAKAVANNNVNLKTVSSKTGNWIEARHDVISDHEYFKTSYQWFVSRKGFNIPLSGGMITEEEVGTIYPAFPFDYEPLPLNFDTIRLNDLTSFAGKHVLFTAEPVSIYGKFGSEIISNSIYVVESVLQDKLLVQLDASLIDEANGTQVRKSGTNTHVVSLVNQVEMTKSANQGTNSQQPIVKTNAPQTDFVGKFIEFDSNDRLVISGYSALVNKDLSLYMVVRGNSNSVISHSSTTIHVSDTGSNVNNAVLIPLDNGWKIAKKNYKTNNNSAAGNVTIGNVDMDIAEILIYAQLSEADETEVIKHLEEKYKFYVENNQIIKLHDFNDEVFRGESYTLPTTVLATYSNGKTSYVHVTWTNLEDAPGGNVNTSQVRTLNFNGVATNDPTKKVRFRLVIKPVTQLTGLVITPIENPLEIGDVLTMTYSYLPNIATIQTSRWTSSDENVAKIDSKTGELTALANGNTMISVQANGLTSLPVEVKVGIDLPPVITYLVEWNFESGVEGWGSNNITNFRTSDGVLLGRPTTNTNSYMTSSILNLKVNKSSKVEVRLKNSTNATVIRIRFRNVNHNNFNQGGEKIFSITANDSEFKTYSFDFSDVSSWANASNNLNYLRVHPTYNISNQGFEIDYIKITQ